MNKQYFTIIWNILSALVVEASIGKTNTDSTSTGPLLLYSTKIDIRALNATIRNNQSDQIPWKMNPDAKPYILLKNVSECAAIDFHYMNKKLFWTDQMTGSIQAVSYTLNDQGTIEINNEIQNITKDLSSPDGLACDWLSNNIYWTDSETKHIEVASIEGGHRKVLFWTELDQPRAIAVLPMKGLMFWTDWGESPKIERAGMNGDPSTRQVIVSNHIIWPNGLTIDYIKERIYWIDGKLQLFEVMDYNGGKRQRVVGGMNYPFALTQYQNKFYWTDWETGSIHYYDQSTPNKSAQVLIHSDKMPMDIHVWDAKRQPQIVHPCSHNNGGCSHLCLLAPHSSSFSAIQSNSSISFTYEANRTYIKSSVTDIFNPGYTCACPIGTKLIDNTTCADGPQEILLIARKSDVSVVYLDSPDFTDRELKLTNIKYSIGVDYDPVNQFVYWSDDEIRRIQRARLDGSNQQDVLTRDIHHPDGVSVDALAGNIYWADTGTDRIEVARLDGHHRRVIIGDDLYEPRAVVTVPLIGYLFWSDWYEKRPKIERSNLDGSERTVLVYKDLVWPNGIAVDSHTSRIYWCDAKTDKIEYANLDGSDRRSLVDANLPHCFGLSLIGDFVYWTDWQRRTINRVHKESGMERLLILEQIENVMGLKAIQLTSEIGTNACSKNNGGCQHLCLYRHNKTYICACEIDFELHHNKNCVKPQAFLLYSKNSNIGRLSIENSDNDVNLFIPGVRYPSSIDFEVKEQRLYWSDSRLRTIMRAYINGSDVQRVIELGLVSPESIAIDWTTLNIYWTDLATCRIEVARLDGSSRRTLLWRNVNEPHRIAVDPQHGYMYWSEWGHIPAIRKASMDGSTPITLLDVTGNVTGLTIDHIQSRLYWATTMASLTELSAIYSSDLNGNNHLNIISNHMEMPTGLTVFGNSIYWTGQTSGIIWQANLINVQNRSAIKFFKDPVIDLIIFSDTKQTRSVNQSAVQNGGCSHLCLTVPQRTSTTCTCACPTHYILQNTSCIPPANFMLYSQKNLAVRLIPDTADCLDAVLPIQGLKGVKAIDFDPGLQFLYWIEGKTHAIKRAKAVGLHMSIVLPPNQDNHPFDLALDAIGRLLFWSCSLKNVINVTRLENNSAVGVIVNGEKPRLLAIHPTKRLLFYTDIHTNQLIRTRMDGTQRFVIRNAPVEIEAIAVDTDSDLVLWSEGQIIYMCNIDGDNRITVLNETHSIINQLTVHAGWLYWLDRKLGELHRFELKSGKAHSPVLYQIGNIIDLISVRQPDRSHKCYIIPGTTTVVGIRRCSHFCLIEDDGSDKVNKSKAVCACPQDQSLQEDKRTCIVLPDCGPEHFSCVQYAMGQKECIPITWRCDGQNDCNDNSDEDNCPTCRPDQYRCQNSQCIEQGQYCDGSDHCSDRSDELKCCKLINEFRCPRTDVCISTNLLCDGMDNCADGADERADVCANSSPHINRDYRSSYVVNAIIIMFAALCTFLIAIFACYFLRRKYSDTLNREMDGHLHLPLNPHGPPDIQKSYKLSKGIPDLVHMSMIKHIGGSNGIQKGCNNGVQADAQHQSTSSYDRNHITGASSSTNDSCSLVSPNQAGVHLVGSGYPSEPLNPPPSPVTTSPSSCLSGPNCSVNHNKHKEHYHYYTSGGGDGGYDRNHRRPYRYYRSINQPPPPTPCSTDVCDDSEYNYPLVMASMMTIPMVEISGTNVATNLGANGMLPPPPTPRSQCQSESCPPSPSSRSSTYFSPLPPPPSPVPSTLTPQFEVL